MSSASDTQEPAPAPGAPLGADRPQTSGSFLDTVERIGNKVPNPTIMFVYLIVFVAVLSAILGWAGVSVQEEVVTEVPKAQLQDLSEELGGSIVPFDTSTGTIAELPDYLVSEQTVEVRSLLSGAGIAEFFAGFVANFAGFGVVAVVLIAMAGVGVAEEAGLMGALIRAIVRVAPPWSLAFILIFVGVLSSVATDAGYLILVPLAAAAFLSVGRHPLAGMAGAFAAVGAVFTVNIIPTPSDSMITEITNDVLSSDQPALQVTANYYFSIACSLLLAALVTFLTVKVVEPRLGPYVSNGAVATTEDGEIDHDAERKGLRYALWALVAVTALVLVLSVPSWGPLRDAQTGDLIGVTPFMNSLVFIISLAFLVCGVAYGRGAGTLRGGNATVAAVAKTFASLGGLLVMFLMIAQFIALFNWTNLPRVTAIWAAHLLEQANVPAVVLLVLFILVIFILDIILPGLIPKWAIFAPVFIPIFSALDVAPQTLLAAYRVGDAPMNVITPLMVYLPFIVTVTQRYKKGAGMGTVISLMLPYTVVVLVVWTLIFAAWFLLGIPWGPGAPVTV